MKAKKISIPAILYILLSGIFTSTVLLYYSHLLTEFVPSSNLIREYLICFGQLFFQGAILLACQQKKSLILEYLKNMMSVSLLGGLLLLPMFVVAYCFSVISVLYLVYFFAVVVFMFLNHKTRVKAIHAPIWLTYTWVLYRCIVLLIIM